MTKFVAVLFLFLYFITFSGATLTVHYCDGSVAAVQVNEVDQNKTCSKNKACMKQQKPCCQNRQAVFKISGKHEAATQTIPFQKSIGWFETDFTKRKFLCNNILPCSLVKKHESNISPPIPIYRIQCVFRI